ncbi:MAG: ATP-binding protein [Bryobacteraceae bacterium]
MSGETSRESGSQATFRARNDLGELARLHEFLSGFSARHCLSPDLEADCELAVEEIFVNVVRYGYPQGGEHGIDVSVALEHGVVTLTVEDDGVAFNPLTAKPTDLELPLEARGIGGLGIHLVMQVIDDLAYERVGDRNRMVMRKKVAS